MDSGHENARQMAIDAWQSGDFAIPLSVQLPEQHWVYERSRGEQGKYSHSFNEYRKGSMLIHVSENNGIAEALMRKMPVIVPIDMVNKVFPEHMKGKWYHEADRPKQIECARYRFSLRERHNCYTVILKTIVLKSFSTWEFDFQIVYGSADAGIPEYRKSKLDSAWKAVPPPKPPLYENIAKIMADDDFVLGSD